MQSSMNEGRKIKPNSLDLESANIRSLVLYLILALLQRLDKLIQIEQSRNWMKNIQITIIGKTKRYILQAYNKLDLLMHLW